MDKKTIRNLAIFSGIILLGGAIVIVNNPFSTEKTNSNENLTESSISVTTTMFTEPMIIETTEITTTSIFENRDPEEFYKNYEPLKTNFFNGNEVVVDESVYAKQIEEIDEELEFLYGKEYNPSLESKLLINALLSNENLSLEDKMTLFPMIKYFNDNPHINKQEYYDRLLNLKIDYINDEQQCGAAYLPDINTIEIYNSFVAGIYHEFFHSTVPLSSNDIGGFVDESVTMILNDEYFSRNLNTYEMGDNRVLYIKMMMETIGTDKVLEAYTKNDWRIIETELLKINSDSSIPNRMRVLMDKYTEIHDNCNYDRNAVNREAESVKNELSEIMINYYNTKYPNDEDSLFYVYESKFMIRANSSFLKTSKIYFNKERMDEESEKIQYGNQTVKIKK